MELVKKSLNMLCAKSRAVNQLTFDEDMNVPDNRPDISRMIQKKGEIQVDEVQIGEGTALISGALVFRLLYVADTPGRKVCSLEGKLPLSETLHLEGLQSGDKVCLKWEIEDLTLHIINSRKLNVKAVVEFQASADELMRVELPVDVAGAAGAVGEKENHPDSDPGRT